jgi:hypothetical protein
MTKVTNIDKPRCNRCGALKQDSALNGYDPFAPVGQKYRKAYCRNLSECNSSEAISQMESLTKTLDEN